MLKNVFNLWLQVFHVKHENKVIIYFGGYLGKQIQMIHFQSIEGSVEVDGFGPFGLIGNIAFP